MLVLKGFKVAFSRFVKIVWIHLKSVVCNLSRNRKSILKCDTSINK